MSSKLKLLPSRVKLNFYFIKNKKKTFIESLNNFSIVNKSRSWTSNKIKQFNDGVDVFTLVKLLTKWLFILFILYYKQESIIHYFRDIFPYELYFSADLYIQLIEYLCILIMVGISLLYALIYLPVYILFPNINNFYNINTIYFTNPKLILQETINNDQYKSNKNNNWALTSKKLTKINENKKLFKKGTTDKTINSGNMDRYNRFNNLTNNYKAKYLLLTPHLLNNKLVNFKWLSYFSSLSNKYFTNLLANKELIQYSNLPIKSSNSYLWNMSKLFYFNKISIYLVNEIYQKKFYNKLKKIVYLTNKEVFKYKVSNRTIWNDLFNLNLAKQQTYNKTFFIRKK